MISSPVGLNLVVDGTVPKVRNLLFVMSYYKYMYGKSHSVK